MDFESFGNLSVTEINEISKVFLETLQNLTNTEVVIYSNTYYARTIFDTSLTKYLLWVANYDVSQPGANGKWNTWVGWQYTSMGNVNGVNGYVDKNEFTDGIFLSTSSELPTPPTANPETPSDNTGVITYRVKSGDTLSAIALKFGRSVSEIAKLNNIKNPNLIYAGNIIHILNCRD